MRITRKHPLKFCFNKQCLINIVIKECLKINKMKMCVSIITNGEYISWKRGRERPYIRANKKI